MALPEMKFMGTKKLAGWCTLCGGEYYDPGPRHRCPRRLRDYTDEQIKREYGRRFGRSAMLEKVPEGGTHYGTPE